VDQLGRHLLKLILNTLRREAPRNDDRLALSRKGKGNKARIVPLNAKVRDALTAIRLAPAEGSIFRGKRGPYTDRGIGNLLAVLGRRADVAHVHPHRFRHDTARRLVEVVDLPTAAALLGHSRLETVRIYPQPDEAALERAVAALEAR
jgi:integrase